MVVFHRQSNGVKRGLIKKKQKQGRIHGHRLRTGGQGRKCAFSHFSTRSPLRTNQRTEFDLFTRNGSIPSGSLKEVLTDSHTSAVAVSVDNMDLKPNRVLGVKPPPVCQSEKFLRHWRSALSQLRSGFCRALRSYSCVLDNSSPLCVTRGSYSRHEHLFV